MRLGLRKFSWPGLVVVIGTLAIVVAGCGSSNSTGGALPYNQQIITLPLVAGATDITTMDPATVTDIYSASVIQLVFPGLLVLNSADEVVPWAATALPVYNPTNLTYTFTVRPGLKWSDGTPINAQTFAYSINRAVSPCTASEVASYMFPIKDAPAFNAETCNSDGVTVSGSIPSLIGDSITTPSTDTLVIQLSAPAAWFLEALTFTTTYAQPEQLIEKYGNTNWTNHLTDNGGFGGNLYNLTVWDHKGHIDLTANPNFWGPAPKAKQIDLDVYQTPNADYAAYLDGTIDQGIAPAPQYKQSAARSDFHQVPWLATSYYQPNWDKAPFNSVQVRQAFDLAINKDIIANNILQGSVIATNHIVPLGIPGYDTNLVGPDGTANLTGNPTLATSLMQAYANANCPGKLIANCPAVTLVDTNSPDIVTQDQAVVGMWESAFPGLKISTQFIDFSTLIKDITSGQPSLVPQIYGIGWSADYPDQQDWLSLQFSPTASNNFGNVDLPAANTLMAEADANQNPTTRAQEYNQAEQLLVTNVAWIPTFQQKIFYNSPTWLHNLAFNSFGYIPMSSWDTMYLSSH